MFILLITGVFLLLAPVSRSLESALEATRERVIQEIEDTTALRLSYSSMSPSIFRALSLRNLVVTDAINGSILARIEEVSLSVYIPDLFTKGLLPSIRAVNLKNGYVTLDEFRNREVISRFQHLDTTNTATSSQMNSEGLERLLSDSLSITIRNIDVSYSKEGVYTSATIIKGGVRLTGDTVAFDIDTRARFISSSVMDAHPLTGKIVLKGEVDRLLTTGSAALTLQSLEGKGFSVDRFTLVVSYRDGMITADTIQDLQPIDISLVWDVPAEDILINLKCERLLPLRWISLTDKNKLPVGLTETEVSGDMALHIKNSQIAGYSANLEALFSSSFYSGGVLSVDLDGDASLVTVDALSVAGPRFDLDFSGFYDIAAGIPEGLAQIRTCMIRPTTNVTADVYLQREEQGFSAIIPELRIARARYDSVQLTVRPEGESLYECVFSANDGNGHIGAEGTWSREQGSFFQGYLFCDSLDAANLAGMAYEPSAQTALPSALQGWGLTTELYLSSDFTSFSFNVTRLILASSSEDGSFILLSAKGNEQGIDITDISLSALSMPVGGAISIKRDGDDLLFDSTLTVNAIPYSVSGMYSKGNLSLYGDYNLAVSAIHDPITGISGAFRVSGFPIPAGTALLSVNLDAGFVAGGSEPWRIVIRDGLIEELNGYARLSSRLVFSGTIESGGAHFHELVLTDEYSTVSGFARVNLATSLDGISQYQGQLRLESENGLESYALDAQITNAAELFIDATLAINGFPLMRVMTDQDQQNGISAVITCSGTPSTLMASANLGFLSVKMNGHDLHAQGAAMLEDRTVSIYGAGLSWNGQNLTGIEGSFSLDTGEALVSSAYNGVLDESGINGSLSFRFVPDTAVADNADNSLVTYLSRYTATLSIQTLTWNTIDLTEPFVVSLVHEPGITALYAGKNEVITGFLLEDGTFSLHVGEGLPIRFSADGLMRDGSIAVTVDGIRLEPSQLWPLAGIDVIAFDSGVIEGSLIISGLLSDPDFNGMLYPSGIVVRSPDYAAEVFTQEPFVIRAEGKTLSARDVRVTSSEGDLTASCTAYFDRWIPNRCELSVRTVEDDSVLAATENEYFKAEGSVDCDLDMSFSREEIRIAGNAGFENGFFTIIFSEFSKQYEQPQSISAPVYLDISLDLGKKVEFRWPTDDFPILRGLIQADEPVRITYDSSTNRFSLKGQAQLKGGEVFYIKRSFYLRQGSIVFNENQDIFDPLISMRAEIREMDEEGEPVRIILSVENQGLTSFTPLIYSEPPKAYADLMTLLGQAASGDSSRDSILRTTVITASDILAQMGFFRGTESWIRDMLHLDIFSIRTLLLQNAIFGQSIQANPDAKMTVGNYFDNTTVYMGKYFGSAVYADALMHFSYYDQKTAENSDDKKTIYGNLLFQPELGLEFTTPFFLVRWGISPESYDTFFVGDTSITLSWKFSY